MTEVKESVHTRYKVVGESWEDDYPDQEEVRTGSMVWYIPREAFQHGYFGEGVNTNPTPLEGLLRSDGVVTINGTILPFEQVIMLRFRPLFLTVVPVV